MEDTGPLRGKWLLHRAEGGGMEPDGTRICPGVLLMTLGLWLQTSKSWCGSRAATM